MKGGHQGISFLIIERGEGCSRARCASSAGTPPTRPRSRLDGRLRARGEPARSEHGGFYLIMANFQWERLLMALGAVGAMQACFEQTLAFVLRGWAESGLGRRSATGWRRSRSRIEAGRDVTSPALRRPLPARTPSARSRSPSFTPNGPPLTQSTAACRSTGWTPAQSSSGRPGCPAWTDRRWDRRDHREILGRSLGL